MLRRNEWCDVADAINISIAHFCKNVVIGQYILRTIARFCENVGIDEYFLRAMLLFFKNVGIECDFL